MYINVEKIIYNFVVINIEKCFGGGEWKEEPNLWWPSPP